MRRIAMIVSLGFLVLTALAWSGAGHRTMTELAIDLLPAEAPAWIRTSEVRTQAAYQSNEPDRWRGTRIDVLTNENGPDHFLDVELLAKSGHTLKSMPKMRYEFVAQVARATPAETEVKRGVAKFTKDEVGYLPYAIVEHQAKLVSSFNTLRILETSGGSGREAELAAARANAIHEMGQLSHFVSDAAQPLHSTIHHHGWVGENKDGFTTDKGFHSYIDGDVVKLHVLDLAGVAAEGKAMRVMTQDQVWDEAIALIERSFAAVRPLYELQKSGELQKEPGKLFIRERMADGASVLSGMYWAAWVASTPTDAQSKDFIKYDDRSEKKKPAESPKAPASGKTSRADEPD